MKNILFLSLAFIGLTLSSCESKGKYNLYVKFPTGNNLKIGADVKSRDLAIGSVESLDLFGSEGVLVGIQVDPKYKIPKNSKVQLKVENIFIGEKYINIDFSDSAEFWDNNDTLEGIPSGFLDFNIEDMGLEGFTGFEEMTKMLESIDLSEIQEQLENLNIEGSLGNIQEELDKMSPEELEEFKRKMEKTFEDLDIQINKEEK